MIGRWEGLGAGLIALAVACGSGDHAAPTQWGLGGALLAAWVALSWPIWGQGGLGRVADALGRGALAFLVALGVDWGMSSWEERAPRFGAFSVVAAPALSALGTPAISEGGALHVRHREGMVDVVPSMEKTGARWFVVALAAWLALRATGDRRKLVGLASWAVLAFSIAALVRYVAVLAAYVDQEKIMEPGPGQEALDGLGARWTIGAALALAGLALDLIARRSLAAAPPPTIVPRPGWRSRLATGLAALALGLGTGLAWWAVPPGPEKGGRVLIDDRFCGTWEPTARQLDTEWYGDFSTYSFTSLAEWLGHWFSVDVNTTKTYDDALLADYDVLVIKTPVDPVTPDEVAAIDRFVNAGGGLLLVGDHTNLLGEVDPKS